MKLGKRQVEAAEPYLSPPREYIVPDFFRLPGKYEFRQVIYEDTDPEDYGATKEELAYQQWEMVGKPKGEAGKKWWNKRQNKRQNERQEHKEEYQFEDTV